MKHTLLTLSEAALNRTLRLDPQLGEVLAPLDGKRIAVTVEGPVALALLVEVGREGVRLWEGEVSTRAHVTLRGSPAALLALLSEVDDALPGRSAVAVHGEARVLEDLKRALARLRIDWQEPIARLLGDRLGHPAAVGVEALTALAGRAMRELRDDTAEFLHEESGWLARREEVADFCQQVDSVRDAVERLGKRLDGLERGLE